MALIGTALTADALRLSAPGMPDLEVPLDGSALQPGVETVSYTHLDVYKRQA